MRTNFQMTDQNITMVSGDTLSFNVILKDQNGDPITVDTAHFRASREESIGNLEIDFSLSNGKITQDDGMLIVRMPPSDTSNLVGFFYYDMGVGFGNDYYTILRGMLQIEEDV